MEKMIAFCGLNCTACPALIATQEDDDEKRKKAAAMFSSADMPLNAEDINCDGCLSRGPRLMKFCEVCEVRRCGLEKNVKNCGYCEDYACEKIDRVFKLIQSPEAKATLDEIKGSLET